jgi:hypothetical protein
LNLRRAGFTAFFLLSVTSAAFAIAPVRYFCPRSALFLEFEQAVDERRDPTDRAEVLSNVKLRAATSACRRRGFTCVNVDQQTVDKSRVRYQLVFPTTLKHHRQFVLGEVHLVTRWATIAPSIRKHHPVVVTVWQKIEGVDSAIELTFEQDRGLVYIDGIRTRESQQDGGEMCVLEGDVGLFPNVRIR